MLVPIFQKTSFEIIAGKPSTYSQASEGSGKRVTINFCATCGTKLFLAFERFPEIFGVYGGTFDDPNWFERTPEMSKHIFLAVAQNGTVIPPASPPISNPRSQTLVQPSNPRPLQAPHDRSATLSTSSDVAPQFDRRV
jgi:hypothetical protein